MSGSRSRDKGARGEREAIALLAEHGIVARRTASMQSGEGSQGCGDLIGAPWHVEVKRARRVDLGAAARQAAADCRDPSWVLLIREDRKPWLVACAHYRDPRTPAPSHAWRGRKSRLIDAAYRASAPVVGEVAGLSYAVMVGEASAMLPSLVGHTEAR